MFRNLLMATALALLAGCGRPAAEKELAPPGSEPQTEGSPAPAARPHDWRMVEHGGSADLDFGDGDWAEGESDFHLSCLPGSGKVEVSWEGEPGPATVGAGAAEAAWRSGDSVPADHPVLRALRGGESLRVGAQGASVPLVSTAAGKAEVETFFAYCARPAAAG
ncbi:MAG: hypothetical protein K1X35_06760 [Caulobacteraceae bacterium]|nr:hypothetical protein [Caulobacteraceae bacterium]